MAEDETGPTNEEVVVEGYPQETTAHRSRRIINLALMENELRPLDARKSRKEIAAELGVPYEHVCTQASRLAKAGHIQVRSYRRTSRTQPVKPYVRPGTIAPLPDIDVSLPMERSAKPTPLKKVFDVDALLTRVQGGENISRQERLHILSTIMVLGADQARIQAAKLMEEIENADMRSVGPPPPTNREEIVARLARVAQAAGRLLADQAWTKAFGDHHGATTEASPSAEGQNPATGDGALDGCVDGEPRREPGDDAGGTSAEHHRGVPTAQDEESGYTSDGREPGREHSPVELHDPESPGQEDRGNGIHTNNEPSGAAP